MNRTPFLVSISLLVLALAGCDEPMTRDAGTDTGGPVDTGSFDGGGPIDTGGGTDTPSTTRTCSVGPTGCDIIRQDCPAEGGTAQGCYLAGDETMAETVCAASGVLSEGATCSGLSDCAEGLGCQDGVCRNFCCMETDTDCPIGYRCVPYRDPATTDGVLAVGICDPPVSCVVLPNSGCPDGRACQPGMDGTLSCVGAGTAAVGESCGGSVGCVPGTGCYGMSADDLHCIAYCLLATPDCATGTTCTAQAAVVGGGYGLCTPS